MQSPDLPSSEGPAPRQCGEAGKLCGGLGGEQTAQPLRRVICADSTEWLDEEGDIPFVVTGFPDISESQDSGQWDRWDTDSYKSWFVSAVKQLLLKLRPGCAAVICQTDMRQMDPGGICTCYLNKSFLCSLAAQEVGSRMLWHKIALLSKVGAVKPLKPGYTHMMCYMSPKTADASYDISACGSCPDVINRGEVSWGRGFGCEASVSAVRWLRDTLGATEILDPYCGEGMVLAAANYLGLSATGIDLSEQRCRMARQLRVQKWEGHLVPVRSEAELAARRKLGKNNRDKPRKTSRDKQPVDSEVHAPSGDSSMPVV